LVAIAAILGGVGVTYRASKKALRASAPAKPQPLPPELNSEGAAYVHCSTSAGRKVWCVYADDYRQTKDSSRVDLKGVKLKLFSKTGKTYDLIQSAAASLTTNDNRFYSDGDVEITLGEPDAGAPRHTLVSIKSSGISLDSEIGKADTARPATFVFQNGEGKATGGSYDPGARELLMKSDVELNWKARGPNAKPTKIEAGSLTYREADSVILLQPWGRLTRGDTVVEGQDGVVHLQEVEEEGGTKKTLLHQVQAKMAHGIAVYPNRKLSYAADDLTVEFDDDGVAQTIKGRGNAHLTSNSESAETDVKSDAVDLFFSTDNDESVLQRVLASGNAVVTSKPAPLQGRPLGETHVLSAQSLEMKMRAGGKEIDNVVTHSPGALDFLPNLPAQRRRSLTGNDIAIVYGPENRIASFHAANVKTQTTPTAEEQKRNRTLAVTTSRELAARFDPKTSDLASMEQTGDFAYDEGDRHARAVKATLDSGTDIILLQDSARIWDDTGSTAAPQIRLDQRTGDFTAEGGVKSSRLPDKDPKRNSDMLSGDEPMQAQARKMASTNHNRSIHYEGDAVMSQGANRILADVIDLDRDKRTLVANGNVTTDLWEQPKDAPPQAGPKKSAPANPVRTVAHAPHLVYTDSDRLAVYTGGVSLARGGLWVRSKELRAYLADSGDSRLDKAFADGAVEIVDTLPAGSRTGTGDHSEYYAAAAKVILRGAKAKVVDSVGNTSAGLELTYFPNDDRLLVNGAANDPVQSRITQKRKSAP